MSSILNYNCYGSPKNKPVVFLHGFMGKSSDWEAIIDSLITEYYCVAIDLPGHGKSLINNDKFYLPENTCVLIKQLLSSFELMLRPHLVGYSMGGRLSLCLLLKYPYLFDKVVLESVNPGFESKSERYERKAIENKIIDRLHDEDFNEFLNDWYTMPIFGTIKKHPDFNRLISSRMDNDPYFLAKSMKNFGTSQMPSLWQYLEDIGNPMLVLAGSNDEKYVKIASNTAAVVPSSYVKLITEASHNCHFENTKAYINAIREFF
jgi:2-succinyl-6-hydroxy-2,4-cyclohexadiene-1-carboxylate synthase